MSTNCDIFGAPGRLGAKPCIALKLPFFSSFISFASLSSIAADETNSQNCIIISIYFIILSKYFQPQSMLTLVPGISCFQIVFGSFRIWRNIYSSRLNNNLQMTVTVAVIHQMFLRHKFVIFSLHIGKFLAPFVFYLFVVTPQSIVVMVYVYTIRVY